MINVRIEKDSIAPSGKRLTTYVVQYPRFIHGEVMTHRVFSRNASSSRAIPLKKEIAALQNGNMAYPLEFRKNQKGMQAGDALNPKDESAARFFWEQACEQMIQAANNINNIVPEGVHKQYVNRLLEPFSYISVIVTSTDYQNFFGLRYHEMAQPEINELAKQMYREYNGSKPQVLRAGEWHLPFITDEDMVLLTHTQQIQKSVACCARVSYKNHDGTNPTIEQNEQLYNRLLGSQPIHASPAEHQAMAVGDPSVQSGNFQGWIQYRKTIKGENITEFKK